MDFSVLMSVYKNDDPDHLRLAFDSIFHKQTLKPTEIILVVDGPIEKKLADVILSFDNDYLKTFYLKKNLGLGKALNFGLNKVSYDLVARMDSDDIACPNRFEIQLKEFSSDEDLVLLGGHIEEFGLAKKRVRKVPVSHHQIVKFISKRNPFNHMTVMFKKNAVISSGGYQHMPFYEDYYLWHRMLNNKNGKLRNVDKVLVKARVSNGLLERRHGWGMFKNEYLFYVRL